MLIQSFVKTDFGLRPIGVEVVLVPGVSQIQILGLADQVIKESSKRILSALRHQGFRIPPGKQALVNLQPHYLRKSSQGLDLPIALGILMESDQLPIDSFDLKNIYCYGSLSLKGEIKTPPDLNLLNFEDFEKKVLTGPSDEAFRFPTLQLNELKNWEEEMILKSPQVSSFQYKEPSFDPEIRFDQQTARLMSIVALGEHPLLIAGHAGSGKTTMVECLAQILGPPEENIFRESQKYWKLSDRELRSRPIVQPHHSATPISMVGGGRPLRFGEISLAHGGALILDELLEFHPQVQSALREPMEKSKIQLVRVGSRKEFPAQCLILATTNLCPCGNFQPTATYQCRCSSLKLRNYLEKLTGPFLDRFALFYLTRKSPVDIQLSLKEIKEKISSAREFQRKSRNQEGINQRLPLKEVIKSFSKKVDESLLPPSTSLRRKNSLLRVARTLADLEHSIGIEPRHLEEAQFWTAHDMYQIQRFRLEDFAMRQPL